MKTSDHNEIEKYLDGHATPEEVALLEEGLRHDPALRVELLVSAGIETQLRMLLKRAPGAHLPADAVADAVAVAGMDVPPSQRSIPWRTTRRWIPVAAAAAAVLVAVALPLWPRQPHDIHVSAAGSGLAVRPVPAGASPHAAALEVCVAATAQPPVMIAALPADSGSSGNRQTQESISPVPAPVLPVSGNRVGADVPAAAPASPLAAVGDVPQPEKQQGPGSEASGNHVAMAPTVTTSSSENGSTSAPTVAVAAAVHPKASGQIASASGNVFLTRGAGPGKVRLAAQSGDSLLSGDMIETGPLSGSVLRYGDALAVRLYSSTQLTLNQSEHGSNLLLSDGAVDLRVQKLNPGNNLVVSTPYVEARVVGTEFRVLTDSTGSWVGVKTGRVEVVRFRANGEVVLVDSGYFAASYRGWPPSSMADSVWRSKCQSMTGSPKYP